MEPRDNPAGTPNDEFRAERMARQTAPPELENPEKRALWGLGTNEEDYGPYLIELNVQYVDGLAEAAKAFAELFRTIIVEPAEQHLSDLAEDPPWGITRISKTYFRCEMTMPQWKTLVAADERQAAQRARASQSENTDSMPIGAFRFRTMYKLWPDFPVQAHITHSISTIKADAALRTFEASGEGITWAVIDSGVDGTHPHFGTAPDHVLYDPSVQGLHRCFIPINGQRLDDPDEQLIDGAALSQTERKRRIALHRENALIDTMGHGTHVAGIIAGQAPSDGSAVVLHHEVMMAPGEQLENTPQRQTVTRARPLSGDQEQRRLHGVAPRARLVSLRVLDGQGQGRSSNIIRALEYIREELNDNPKELRVHGVNLSVGYEFDAEMFACGQSPLCVEVNRLAQTGVVVVAAAGNTGYATISASSRTTRVGLANSINDPGNAEAAITVGSTHRDAPHTFGISYFSSKGPTGDGRPKPDLVAPGERILSCAAGQKKTEALDQIAQQSQHSSSPDDSASSSADSIADRACYIDDSGTSMAAPHVSGAIAAFLSIRREFIGQPAEVKRIFLDSAMPLGRERYFEGHGLVDVMKAIQSV